MNDRGESSTSGSSNVMSFLTDSRNKTVKKKVNRKTLTGLEKQSLCIKAQKHPNITLEALAIEFGIKPNTVHDILAEKDIWLALDKNSPLANSKRRKTVGFPTIESALALWVEHPIHHEQALTGEMLKVKAQEFADKMNINELVNRFPIDREEVRMDASEFVNSEDFISVQDMPTTESIIATIEGEDLSESEDSPIVKSISHKSALEHVNSLLLYITQDCDSELQVDTAFLSNLKKLKRTIETKQQNMLQQTSILAFYH